MIVKEREYKKCKSCGSRKLIKDDVYGCDHCGKELDLNNKEVDYLTLQIFHNEKGTESKHYCSWGCVFTALPFIDGDYFVDLPFIQFDTVTALIS